MYQLHLKRKDFKIKIPAKEEFFIGREITGVNDKTCSRKQMLMMFDNENGVLKVKKIGNKQSTLIRGNKKIDLEGDKEMILCKIFFGQLNFSVIFK